MKDYTAALLKEIALRTDDIPDQDVASVYFGGGTPSLLPAEDTLLLRKTLAQHGFVIRPEAEITIEINPGTIDVQKLDLYRAAGVNRFSIGVQTFDDATLKLCGREHSADDSRNTLNFCRQHGLNYSFDLLFGLPYQNLEKLRLDLDELCSFSPPHVSLYNLNVPHAHFMNAHRPEDEVQVRMFQYIEDRLGKIGLYRYELSNFAKPGHESRHNMIYWSDEAYWGLGIAAHSYFPTMGRWGSRFWNAKHHRHYLAQLTTSDGQVSPAPFYKNFPKQQWEELAVNEALTDYCHTQLRVLRGLSLSRLQQKFGSAISQLVEKRLFALVERGLLEPHPQAAGIRLTPQGLPLANQVFLELTFLPKEL